jgi:phosphopantothenoylcysteine decarboxylase/phosphopantothenate--cysteine ligase
LELEPTADIMRAAAEARAVGTLVIAFAAEMDLDIAHVREKLASKGADAIILNDISRPGLGFDSDSNAATFVTPTDAVDLPAMSKRALADRLLTHILTLRRPSRD